MSEDLPLVARPLALFDHLGLARADVTTRIPVDNSPAAERAQSDAGEALTMGGSHIGA